LGNTAAELGFTDNFFSAVINAGAYRIRRRGVRFVRHFIIGFSIGLPAQSVTCTLKGGSSCVTYLASFLLPFVQDSGGARE
jgi:hypothetical protein